MRSQSQSYDYQANDVLLLYFTVFNNGCPANKGFQKGIYC